MVDLGQNPVANPNIVFREEADNWALLFDPDSGEVSGLNPVGVFIWKQLDGTHSVEEIISQIRTSFEDVRKCVEKEVLGFLEKLEKKGFIGYEVS